MARQARGRRIIDDSSDDEFPDIRQIGSFQTKDSKDVQPPPVRQAEEPASKGVVRRRKLGPISDSAVFRPAMARETSGTIFDDDDDAGRSKSTKPRRIELRIRQTKPVAKSFEIGDLSEADSVQEETIIEDFSCDDESDFEASQGSESEGDDPTAGLFLERSPPRSTIRPRGESRATKVFGARQRSPSPSAQLLAEAGKAFERGDAQESRSSKGAKSNGKPASRNAEGSRSITPTEPAGPFIKLKT